MQQFLYIFISMLLALSITGCTATWYEMMEEGRVAACESLHGQEREECLEQARMPYQEYQQRRDEALAKER